MKKLNYSWILIGFLLLSSNVFAQNGTIRGTIYDEGTGEPLFGVAVSIVGAQLGAVTDFDGDFEIELPEGVYSIQASLYLSIPFNWKKSK